MYHCTNFKPYDIWYLNEVDNFERRELKLGFCPKCHKMIGELKEVRKTDGKVFIDKFSDQKLTNLIQKENYRVNYTSSEILRQSQYKVTYGWRYGVNDTITRDGKICIRQFACDFNGTKELLKEIS